MPSNWERILWRGNRSGAPIAIDVVSQVFPTEYARLAADGATELLPLLRAAGLDARKEQFRQENPPGRIDAVIHSVESARDVVSKLVEHARRSRGSRSR